MDTAPSPLAFLLLLLSGWVNRQQQAVIDYLREENRLLRAERGSRRLRLTDDQRRRLAVMGKALGRVASGPSQASSPRTPSSVGTAGSSPRNTPAPRSNPPVAPASRSVFTAYVVRPTSLASSATEAGRSFRITRRRARR